MSCDVVDSQGPSPSLVKTWREAECSGPKTCDYAASHGQGDSTDVSKLKLRTWRGQAELLGEPSVIPTVLKRWKRGKGGRSEKNLKILF